MRRVMGRRGGEGVTQAAARPMSLLQQLACQALVTFQNSSAARGIASCSCSVRSSRGHVVQGQSPRRGNVTDDTSWRTSVTVVANRVSFAKSRLTGSPSLHRVLPAHGIRAWASFLPDGRLSLLAYHVRDQPELPHFFPLRDTDFAAKMRPGNVTRNASSPPPTVRGSAAPPNVPVVAGANNRPTPC